MELIISCTAVLPAPCQKAAQHTVFPAKNAGDKAILVCLVWYSHSKSRHRAEPQSYRKCWPGMLPWPSTPDLCRLWAGGLNTPLGPGPCNSWGAGMQAHLYISFYPLFMPPNPPPSYPNTEPALSVVGELFLKCIVCTFDPLHCNMPIESCLVHCLYWHGHIFFKS